MALKSVNFPKFMCPGAGDERREGAEERHEARDDDRERRRSLLEEVVELGHALGRERLHLPRIDDAAAEQARDPVVRGVAQNGCRPEHDAAWPTTFRPPPSAENTPAANRSESPGRNGKNTSARLHEHDEEERRCTPTPGPKLHDPAGDEAARVFQQGLMKKSMMLHRKPLASNLQEYTSWKAARLPGALYVRRSFAPIRGPCGKSASRVHFTVGNPRPGRPSRKSAPNRYGRSPAVPYGCFLPDLTRFGTCRRP